MKQGFPTAGSGQIIGLLGGSFDPPHEGHLHITRAALNRFALDQVWWLVSPGNPLKIRQPAPMAERMQAARLLAAGPKVKITDIEARLGTRYTAQTLQRLKAHYPQARFVWLMGADNLSQFHRWQDWRWIIENVPVGILARPGDRISARMSKAARVYRHAQLIGRASRALGRVDAPSWCFVNLPMSPESSTAIRARGDW